MGSPTKKQGSGKKITNLERQSNMRPTTTAAIVTVNTEEGETQIVTSPSYHVPKDWVWTEQRIEVAEDLAEGMTPTAVSNKHGIAKKTIYNWLQHPDFRKHVDMSILETGVAMRSLRVAAYKRVIDMALAKVYNEMGEVPLTPSNMASFLSTLDKLLSSLATEKQEVKQLLEIKQDATTRHYTMSAGEFLAALPEQDRTRVEKDLNLIGDALIKGMVDVDK